MEERELVISVARDIFVAAIAHGKMVETAPGVKAGAMRELGEQFKAMILAVRDAIRESDLSATTWADR